MKYFGIVCSSIIVILVPFLFRFFHKRDASKTKIENEIRQSSLNLYIGIAGLIFCDILIPLLCCLELDPTMRWYEALAFSSIIIVPGNILYVYLLLLSVNWKVIVFDDHIEFTNCFRKKKTYEFSNYEIKIYSSSVRVVKSYKDKNNKKKYKCYVNISTYCTNVSTLQEKYKQYKQRKKT